MDSSHGDLAAVLLEWAPDALVVAGADGLIQLANRRAAELFGYETDELIGQPVEMLIPERSRTRHPALRSGYFATPSVRPMGAGLQLWGVRKDSSEFPVDISLSPVSSAGGPVVAAAIRDISDRLAVEDALRQARDEAERANHAKNEFLSRMSHELRTPLTAILGFTELLELAEISAAQRADFIRRVHRAGQHLLALINDVLDISRVEGGSLSLSVESVPIIDLVEEAVALLEPLAVSRDVRFEVAIEPTAVMADMNRLRQVLINLLSNAVKYNRPGGTVTVEVAPVEDRILLSITDTGRGISGQDLGRLFAPFERLGLDSGTIEESAETEGTGIGLALSRGLVELMGGTITVVSDPGVGSTFTVDLPAGRALSAPAGFEAAGSLGVEPGASRARVLYIEDNASNAVLVESALALRPHVGVLLAATGREGFDRAATEQPDLILLDLHLPDVSGREVLAWLSKDGRTKRIPIVVVSADATERSVRELLAAGASAYISKPLRMREFLETVDVWLEKSGIARSG